MKKIDCIFYLVDNYLYLYNYKNNNIKIYNFKNSIYEGRIIKQNVLIKKLNDILKEEKISKIFTGQKAIIIYEPQLKYIDKKIIIDTFEQCGFKDIKLINVKTLLTKNKHYIQVNDNYLIEYYDNKYNVIKLNEYFNLEKLIDLIVKNVKSEIILLGINNNIQELAKINRKLLYFENSKSYFIDKILKDKK